MKKRIWGFAAAVLLCLPLFVSCAPQKTERTFFALDTYVTFTVYGDAAKAEAAEAKLRELEALFSPQGERSDVMAINASSGEEKTVDARTAALLEQAVRVSEETKGAFDPTVAPVVEAYGFPTGEYRVPSDALLGALLPLVDARQIRISEDDTVALGAGQSIDLGAIAKGAIADACANELRASGVKSAILSLGGNVCTVGCRPDGTPFSVAVADPANTDAYLGTMPVCDASLVTAGGYQRYFEQDGVRYHHIIDPKTGKCASSGLLSATVLCADGALADALSTAFFVGGAPLAEAMRSAHPEVEYLLCTEDGRLLVSAGIASKFVPSEDSPYRMEVVGNTYGENA